MITLAELLAPITLAEFEREYRERRPLLVQQRDRAHYGDLLAARHFDRMIFESVSDASDLRMVKDGADDSVSALFVADDRRANLAAVRAGYARGDTVVINNVNRRRPEVAELCRAIELALHHPVNANAYLTPKGAQGFTAHFDDHDVFVLQLEGAKRWRVYAAPSELPLKGERYAKDKGERVPLFEATLAAGNLLYLPRGFVHEADTAASSSLHLTIGCGATRYWDLLVKALEAMAREDVAFRRSLANGLDGADRALVIQETLRALAQRFAESDFAAAVVESDRSFMSRLYPLADGGIDGLDRVGEIDETTVLRKRAGSLCTVAEQDGQATIAFPGNTVGVPAAAAAALRFIAEREQLTVAEIPAPLTTPSKIVLAKRLVTAGLLVVAEAPAESASLPIEKRSRP